MKLSRSQRAFTLLETLLALLVFSTAVVALVEAVHQLGQTTLIRRHEAILQDRMRSLLVEHSRLLWMKPNLASGSSEKILEEDGVAYTLQIAPLELESRDGQRLNEMFELTILANWVEGRLPKTASASTWVYLPLYRPVP